MRVGHIVMHVDAACVDNAELALELIRPQRTVLPPIPIPSPLSALPPRIPNLKQPLRLAIDRDLGAIDSSDTLELRVCMSNSRSTTRRGGEGGLLQTTNQPNTRTLFSISEPFVSPSICSCTNSHIFVITNAK